MRNEIESFARGIEHQIRSNVPKLTGKALSEGLKTIAVAGVKLSDRFNQQDENISRD